MKYMNDQGIFVSQVHKRNDVHTCLKNLEQIIKFRQARKK